MEKFYLGMDIGTESVGMACTDENYNLLRAKGKDLWSVRLFDEAKDASERKTKRSARRRLARRRQRIEWLQEIFAPFMEDSLFFIRLNNSGFYENDKDVALKTRFSVFADENYTDKEFYAQFPTIFHLRKALIEGKVISPDLRLYYLALHHIIKYRGHFLFEGESSYSRDIEKLFEKFNETALENFSEIVVKLPTDKAKDFRSLTLERLGFNDKKKAAFSLLSADTEAEKGFVILILGGTVKATALFGDEYEEYKGEKLCFQNISEEDFQAKEEIFGDNFYILEVAHEIYNYIRFEKILNGKENISSAMVALYDKHKSDLNKLKRLIKSFCPDLYYKVFRSTEEKANYVNYIGYTKSKTKRKNVKKCKPEDFYKFIKKILDENQKRIVDTACLEEIKSDIENQSFLPKILNSDNGLFPHQVNGAELNAILDALSRDFPEFAIKEDGLSPVDKIKKIFNFKIPYYVGPLNSHSKNSWVVKSTGKVTPWNFDELIDKVESNRQFIRRMTNKCTYLKGKDVLPKCSMYYQAFDLLNQLNKIKINEQPIDITLKQELFHNLFLKNKKVTKKSIKDYLLSTGRVKSSEYKDLAIGGFDGEFKANMNSYVTLKKILGDYVDLKPEVCEDIILYHTLFTDKSLVEQILLEKYQNEQCIKDNIKVIKGITSFKEFGRLSKELLLDVYGGFDDSTGVAYSILERLYNTNLNFNELYYSNEYSFEKAIAEENGCTDSKVTYEDIEDLYVSPMLRRGIWQALIMVDEYVNAVGKAPDKIFIEVTREHDKNKLRTASRKEQLTALYSGLKGVCKEIDSLTAELNNKSDFNLRQERLYLYFTQLGRCAYTGERISLDQLSTDLYDVDHIMPRSITKDDSLENKVLVLRTKNFEKRDNYPLPEGFTNQQSFWKLLKEKGLIGEKKYSLLTRTEPLNEKDFGDFINRQLVVTNQTIKAVADLLRRKYESQGTKIVFSKAVNVTDFKQKYDIVKCRETNDLHHARDAYLNIVVGNVYHTKFNSAKDYFRKIGDVWHEYNLDSLFEKPLKGAWNGESDISKIKAVLSKNSMQVTRYTYIGKGSFYDETVYGKEDDGISVPRKNVYPYSQTEKYGGFKSLSTAYFCAVRSKDKKGNDIITLEAIPVLVDYNLSGDKDRLLDYLRKSGLKEPKILVEKIKIKSLVSVNGFKCWIAGKTGTRILLHNANQWFTSFETDKYVKEIVKLLDQEKKGQISEEEKQSECFSMTVNRFGKVKSCVNRNLNLKLYDEILNKLSIPLYQNLSPAKFFYEKLFCKREIFLKLTVFEQCKVILEMVRFMKCNAESSDLTLLKDGSRCGILNIGKNITNVDFAIINQSPCGLSTYIKKI